MHESELARDNRLRSWARRNYVPAAHRPPTWHPTVLEEMQRLDVEMAVLTPPALGSRYVPLPPTLPMSE